MSMHNILKKIPLFSDLDREELDAVVALASSHHYAAKSVIVQEGDNSSSLFVILSGQVKISYYAEDGREVVLSLMSEGSFFGELSLLDRRPRSATVTTLGKSTLAQIRRQEFEQLILQKPKISLKLLLELSGRLRRTNLLLERISTMDVPHRLYHYINDMCACVGREPGATHVQLRLPTHQLISDQLSTSRETISRAISNLKKAGVITPVAGCSEVRIDLEALESLMFSL